MLDAYEEKIRKCKAPKSWEKVRYILKYLILGVRNQYDTATMVTKLNARKIKPLIAQEWTMNNLQMQLMFMARLDEKNTLARGFAYLIKTGEATEKDLALLQDRIR